MVTPEAVELRGNPFTGAAVDCTRARTEVQSLFDLVRHLRRHGEEFINPELVIPLGDEGVGHFALTSIELSSWTGQVVRLEDLSQLVAQAGSQSEEQVALLLFGPESELYTFTLEAIAEDKYLAPSTTL